jgi:hypothetical protein
VNFNFFLYDSKSIAAGAFTYFALSLAIAFALPRSACIERTAFGASTLVRSLSL